MHMNDYLKLVSVFAFVLAVLSYIGYGFTLLIVYAVASSGNVQSSLSNGELSAFLFLSGNVFLVLGLISMALRN